jgi:protein regulator of cytokinesis 1
MAAYLAEHVPHLQRLHVQLGLPPEALQSDQNAIEAAIKNAVTTLIRDREGEVDGWRDAIADVRRSMVSVGRALGEKGRDAVAAARRESEHSIEALPIQHERLVRQREGLEKEYDERLAQIEAVMAQIDQLAVMLGAPFEPAKPLTPIPGPSRVVVAPPAAKTVTRKASLASLTGGPSANRRLSTMPPPVVATETSEATPWYNVADDVLEALQVTLAQAEEERVSGQLWVEEVLLMPRPPESNS